MLVKSALAPAPLYRARQIARRSYGLGAANPTYYTQKVVDSSTTNYNNLVQQLNDANNQLLYLTNQYSINHYGGQTPDQMANILNAQQAKIASIQQQINTAQAQQTSTAALAAASGISASGTASALTPSSGQQINPFDPTSGYVTASGSPKNAGDVWTRLTLMDPNTYQGVSGIFESTPSLLLLVAATAIILTRKRK